jgi:hypothetical protein
MKVIVTENMINDIGDNLKKVLIKHWEKQEYPTYDRHLLKMFHMYNDGIAGNLFRDVIGNDEVKRRTKNVLEKYMGTKTHISCGGYEFDFTVVGWETEQYSDITYLIINCVVDTKNGTVVLVMTDDDRRHNLNRALANDDYGWEIEGEVTDCISDLLYPEINHETAYNTIIRFRAARD